MVNKTHIPNGWRQVHLEEIADVVMGQSPPSTTVVDLGDQSVSDKGLPFIQGNAEFGGRFPSPMKWCVEPLKVAEPNDVLISVRAPVGETNIADRPLAIGRGLAAIRFNGSCPAYGWHILNFAKRAFKRITQGSTFDAIGSNDVRALSILIPPLSEQHVIAAVLDSIDQVIERTSEVIAAKEQLRDSLLHELLTHGIPGWHKEWKEAPSLGTIPASWHVVKLGEICNAPEYGAAAPARPFEPGLPRYVRITDITDDGRLRSDDIRSAEESRIKGYELHIGDFLFARSGKSVGRTYLYSAEDGPCTFAGYLIRFRPKPEIALPCFIKCWTHSIPYRKWITSMLRAGAQPNINATEYSSMRIPLPLLDEQRAIAGLMDGVDMAIEQERQVKERLQSLKVSIADALLTGWVQIQTEGTTASAWDTRPVGE